MGIIMSSVSSVLDSKMKEQQEFMSKSQKVKQLTARNMQMSLQVSLSRERMWWFIGVYGLLGVGATAACIKQRRFHPGLVAPIIIFGGILGYSYDAAWGTKLNRCRLDADNIMKEKQFWFVQELEDAKKELRDYKLEHGLELDDDDKELL